MLILISPSKIDVPAGTVIRVPATWQDYQQVANRRGDSSLPRIKYCNGEMRLMVPLPEHGKDASFIADFTKVLLDVQELEYDAFTPITMTLPEAGGIEPDYCFYIQNLARVRGKKRIDWQIDPPPDLVLEVDVTSYSNVDDYLPYQVPEVWMFKQDLLNIHRLDNAHYRLTTTSCYFPELELQPLVAHYRQIAYQQSTSQAIRQLRQQFSS
ncbi:Uma2 family endonuclease [bacterium]|nr:Uma2 family endonuclease [bacterium]